MPLLLGGGVDPTIPTSFFGWLVGWLVGCRILIEMVGLLVWG